MGYEVLKKLLHEKLGSDWLEDFISMNACKLIPVVVFKRWSALKTLHFSVALFEGQTGCRFCPSKRATGLSLKKGNLFVPQKGQLRNEVFNADHRLNTRAGMSLQVFMLMRSSSQSEPSFSWSNFFTQHVPQYLS